MRNYPNVLDFNNKVVAKSYRGVYIVKVCKDGSSYLWNEAANGYRSCMFCGLDTLRSHLIYLANLLRGSNWESSIPDDWEIIDRSFFDRLNIK